ncbi:hypothetical protein GC197_03215 [bacterium]|nr:hypothetical protein [bacterium]
MMPFSEQPNNDSDSEPEAREDIKQVLSLYRDETIDEFERYDLLRKAFLMALNVQDWVAAKCYVAEGIIPAMEARMDSPLVKILERYANDKPQFDDCLKWLVASGANLQSCGIVGHTPVIFAITSSLEYALEALLKAGADPNAPEPLDDRLVPLMYAVRVGDIKLGKLLLQYGADPLTKDKQGRNAIDHAEKHGCPELASIFRTISNNN